MIAEVLLSLFFVWLVRHVITTYLARRNMPPGPFPFPFIGNIPHLLYGNPVNPYTKLAEKYGDIFTVTFPKASAIVLNTATLAREARVGRKEDIVGRLPESIYPWPEIFGVDLITANYSPVYQFRRRVFKSAMHVFGAGIEKAEERARLAAALAVEDIEQRKGEAFSPKEIVESSILVQLWEWMTSKKVGLNDPVIKKIAKFAEIIAKQGKLSKVYQVFPFLSYLPTKFKRDIELGKKIRSEVFPQEFREHMDTYTPGVNRDLTDSFIECYEKEIAKETSKDIGSIEDIPGLMVDVAFAGSDTTSSSLAWLLLYMVLNPDVQEKIHDELNRVVGENRLPIWKDHENMPYLQATLCEGQRASGMIVSSGTCAIRDTSIAGYHVPKGTFVLINYSKIHHDEREWPEPEKFKPERFLDSDGNFVGWHQLNGFLPFSTGRRDCAGQSLARIMLFTFASTLLHRYKIVLPDGEKLPTTEVSKPASIIRPKDFKIVAKKRHSNNNLFSKHVQDKGGFTSND